MSQSLYHCSGHDPEGEWNAISNNNKISQGARNLPSGSTDDTVAFVLLLDGIEFEIYILADIADEGEDFTDAVVDNRQCGETIDYGA
jgi:hypothetical protein